MANVYTVLVALLVLAGLEFLVYLAQVAQVQVEPPDLVEVQALVDI